MREWWAYPLNVVPKDIIAWYLYKNWKIFMSELLWERNWGVILCICKHILSYLFVWVTGINIEKLGDGEIFSHEYTLFMALNIYCGTHPRILPLASNKGTRVEDGCDALFFNRYYVLLHCLRNNTHQMSYIWNTFKYQENYWAFYFPIRNQICSLKFVYEILLSYMENLSLVGTLNY